MAHQNRIINRFPGDDLRPIAWSSEEEKELHFWIDDLRCPPPESPMWFDSGSWWHTCGYMYRRLGLRFGKDWVAKKVDEYVFSAVVPRKTQEASGLDAYCQMVMPLYATNFLRWWKQRYPPEIRRNFEFLDGFPMETSSLPELMILLEDARDIQERHFRLDWILNLAQFQSAIAFQQTFTECIGAAHAVLIWHILVSDDDRGNRIGSRPVEICPICWKPRFRAFTSLIC